MYEPTAQILWTRGVTSSQGLERCSEIVRSESRECNSTEDFHIYESISSALERWGAISTCRIPHYVVTLYGFSHYHTDLENGLQLQNDFLILSFSVGLPPHVIPPDRSFSAAHFEPSSRLRCMNRPVVTHAVIMIVGEETRVHVTRTFSMLT